MLYDDGDEEWVDLGAEKFRWVDRAAGKAKAAAAAGRQRRAAAVVDSDSEGEGEGEGAAAGAAEAAASGSEYAASGDEESSDEESLAAEDSEEESEEDDSDDDASDASPPKVRRVWMGGWVGGWVVQLAGVCGRGFGGKRVWWRRVQNMVCLCNQAAAAHNDLAPGALPAGQEGSSRQEGCRPSRRQEGSCYSCGGSQRQHGPDPRL